MLDETPPTAGGSTTGSTTSPRSATSSSNARSPGFERSPTPQAHVVTGWMGGAIDRVAPGETAFGHRAARAFTWIIGCSGDGPSGRSPIGCAQVWERHARFATGGVYVNALDAERSVRDAYADDVWERLVEVKRRYDPDGVFAGQRDRLLEPFANGVRSRLGAAAHAELREHPADVVLGGLRRDHQPLGDLRVRQPRRDEAEHLALTCGQLVASPRTARAARGAELPQQRGRASASGLAPSARRRRVPRVRTASASGEPTLRLSAREAEAGAGLLEREPQIGEAGDGSLELGRRGIVVAAGSGDRAADAAARPRHEVVTGERRPSRAELAAAAGGVEVPAGQSDSSARGPAAGALGSRRRRGDRAAPGQSEVAALDVQFDARRERRWIVVQPGRAAARPPPAAPGGAAARRAVPAARARPPPLPSIGPACGALRRARPRRGPVAGADENGAVDRSAPRLQRA